LERQKKVFTISSLFIGFVIGFVIAPPDYITQLIYAFISAILFVVIAFAILKTLKHSQQPKDEKQSTDS